MRYSVLLLSDAEAGRYVAHVPAIAGCVTQAETIEEALEMAEDAAIAMLRALAERSEELPTEAPGAIVGSVAVSVPALVTSP